ncbi:MAG: MBL fold metallo-hydrolase, partial [Oscillospiraceae bacterium]|nr:MBL fold metallo-hydrolase [Oscillospiraceae bacterium]
THEVTGSCTLLEVCGKQILVDCGMEQGADIYENCELPIAPGDIDAVCLTHAHIDHSGKIPALVAQGFRGPIYATEATARLCGIMLRDSAHIQESEAQWRNRKAERSGGEPYVPLYTMADAEQAIRQFQPYPYDRQIELFPGVQILFQDAGHLLGSASIYITMEEAGQTETVLFSGDLGNHTRPLIRDPKPARYADYVVIESTYGDRLHGARPDYVGQLTQILQETFDQGGNVVIPSFAIGRTQELLYLMRTIKEQGLLRGHEDFAVYVDSPLAVEATRIYSCGMLDYYDDETLALLEKGIDPISFPGLKLSVTADESKLINFDQTPKVILSASGMCEAGRIRHHLKHNLWRGDCTILFVGYQSEGTVGRKLIEGAQEVKLFGETIVVHARIETLAGISGHADRDMLVNWLKAMGKPPKQVFVNHGDDTVCDSFADFVEKTVGYPALAPFSGDEYDLITGQCTAKGKILRVSKQSKGRAQANAAFERLTAAGKRLLSVIQKNKGLANKELAKFADQIIALCNKYDR